MVGHEAVGQLGRWVRLGQNVEEGAVVVGPGDPRGPTVGAVQEVVEEAVGGGPQGSARGGMLNRRLPAVKGKVDVPSSVWHENGS